MPYKQFNSIKLIFLKYVVEKSEKKECNWDRDRQKKYLNLWINLIRLN